MRISAASALAVISFFTVAQGIAVDTDAGQSDISKRAGVDFAELKVQVGQAKGEAWVVGFFDSKDCKGNLLGHADADTKNTQPCMAVKDMKSKPDQKKIQSGAVWLQRDAGNKNSAWSAKLVEKGDALSPCGLLTSAKLGNGWIGFDLPADGWTCQNGHYSAYTVDFPGK
ncbi:MAG: hypothetical protein M1812_003962 [Candelaria pacifica]|nr:MAG: hypothetical protein M1812_003962 [Candelaria pacifica]